MGHILDLIITRSSDNIIKGTPSPDSFLSDHCSVWCCLNVTKVLATVKHISFRKLKSLDLVAFKNDIASSDLCNIASNDCNEVAELYNNYMRSILDRHAPMTSKRVLARTSAPWMSSNIIETKCQPRKVEIKWRSSKCQSDLTVFKRKRNHVTFLMNEARRVYYCTLIAENSHDQKHMFKVSKKLLNITGTPVLPRNEDKQKLAYEMGMFFIKIFDSLLFKFSSLSQEEVHDLVWASSKKSCGLDPIPTKLLLDCLDVLLPTITKMINYSLEYGDFSSAWKIALVLKERWLKKDGLEPIFKNYRPVSILQFVFKLTESAVAKQLHRHMVACDLFPVVQSSYRKFHIVMQMTANFICPSAPMPVLTKMLLWLEWKAVLMIFVIGCWMKNWNWTTTRLSFWSLVHPSNSLK